MSDQAVFLSGTAPQQCSQILRSEIQKILVRVPQERQKIVKRVQDKLSQNLVTVPLPNDYDPCLPPEWAQGANTLLQRLPFTFSVLINLQNVFRAMNFYPEYRDQLPSIAIYVTCPLKIAAGELIPSDAGTVAPAPSLDLTLQEMVVKPLRDTLLVSDNFQLTKDQQEWVREAGLRVVRFPFTPTVEGLAGMFWNLLAIPLLVLHGVFISKIELTYQGITTQTFSRLPDGSFVPSPYLLRQVYRHLVDCC